jgi:hypothetical protein
LLNLNEDDISDIFKKRGPRARFRHLLQKLKVIKFMLIFHSNASSSYQKNAVKKVTFTTAINSNLLALAPELKAQVSYFVCRRSFCL